MLRIARFLKPFPGLLVLAILLLVVQALCDLNLPNLMSNIVNVGIQQGGVEDSTPRALSTQSRDFLEIFMTDEEKDLLNDNYELVRSSSVARGAEGRDGKTYADLYPAAGSELYILNPFIDADTLTQLNGLFGTTTWTMVNALRTIKQMTEENTPEYAIIMTYAGDLDASTNIRDIDLKQIYQLGILIKLLPPYVISDAHAQAAAMDPELREQSSTMLVGAFYTELGVNMNDLEISYIVRIGLTMLLITLIGGLATVLVGLISSRVGAGVARDLRSSVFRKVTTFSHTEFDRFSTASLITRSTNDVSQIQTLVTLGIRIIFYAPIMGIGAIFMALQKSVSMSWIIGVAVIFMLGMVGILVVIVMPRFKIIQKLIDHLNLVARETLIGQMVVRAFSRAPYEMERFDRANLDVTKTNLFIQRAMVFLMPIMMVFMNGLAILVIWIGAEQVAASAMQVGDMMAYLQYAMMVIMSFMFIAMAFIFVPRAAVSAGRIADVLETEPVIASPKHPVQLPADLPTDKRGRVELINVSFSYEGAEVPALEHINFVAEPGQTTAIIGSTGSGKSSILNLIPRFYDPDAGTVLFDGVDVRELAVSDLRSRIGYVPQKSLLMSGTVAENISYGNPSLSDEEIERAAEIAQALDFISKLEETDEATEETTRAFDFRIAQGGGNISGGQKQRLAIARALAVNPEVFLFDDSFSALDFATDAALRKALAAYTGDATLIIVAQRVSTIMDAAHIYVVDEGKIIGQGTHAELLRNCEAYREVAETQLSPEELEATSGGDAR